MMVGHKHIIAARKSGLKPAAIFIDAGYSLPAVRFPFEDPERQLDYGMLPTVTIPPDELGKRLDLRFLAGCSVHIFGREVSNDILDLADRVTSLASKTILAAGTELMIHENGEWTVCKS
jgi:hypothetical protein